MALESVLFVTLLSIITLSLVTLTLLLFTTSKDLRRALKEFTAILPECDTTLQEVHRTFTQAKSLIMRANRTAVTASETIAKTCHVASEVLEPFVLLGGKVRSFLNGNRRQHERSSNKRRDTA